MHVITGSDAGQLKDAARPLVVAGASVARPHRVAEHAHRRRQLLYATGGLAHVRIGEQRWTLTHNQGIWIPEGLRHEVSSHDSLSYRSVFVDPAAASGLSLPDGPVTIPAILHELIGEAREFGVSYECDTPEFRLISVLFDQLDQLQKTELPIPLPHDQRLQAQCRKFLADPASDMTQQQWASACGLGSRTMARMFWRETGMSFLAWRERVRLLLAIDRLRSGALVTTVALDLGYKSSSAFSAMFRRVTGSAPSRYLAQHQQEE